MSDVIYWAAIAIVLGVFIYAAVICVQSFQGAPTELSRRDRRALRHGDEALREMDSDR